MIWLVTISSHNIYIYIYILIIPTLDFMDKYDFRIIMSNINKFMLSGVYYIFFHSINLDIILLTSIKYDRNMNISLICAGKYQNE